MSLPELVTRDSPDRVAMSLPELVTRDSPDRVAMSLPCYTGFP